MKANEAPEKIYLFENPISGTPDDRWLSKRSDDEDVEYVRKDAFIEKACGWLHRGLEDTKVIDEYRDIVVRGIQASYTSVEEFIEDFKKYMEE